MKHGELKITTRGDRELVMTRVIAAPRTLVFDAHTKPELVKRWLLGPPGWSMPVCVRWTCGWAARTAGCGGTIATEPRWGWAVPTAKSVRRSDSSPLRS